MKYRGAKTTAQNGFDLEKIARSQGGQLNFGAKCRIVDRAQLMYSEPDLQPYKPL